MEQNKTGKYLKYAIGEIVLVVIGILIALSINNGNEKRKLNNTIKNIYSIIQSDLLSDIETIDGVFVRTKFRDSLFKLVINNDLTYDDYLKCNYCISILNGYPDIKLKTRGLNLLKQNSVFLSSYHDSLSIEISDFYSFHNTEIDISLSDVDFEYFENRAYFKKNMTWFVDYLYHVMNEEFIKYALSSFDYRNRVNSFYRLYYKIYLDQLKQYKEEALVLITNINMKAK